MDDPARRPPSSVPVSDTQARGEVPALRYRGRNLSLARERVLIGRSDECDVIIDNSLVSRRHALIEIQGDAITIEDLGSKNGVFVNDAPLIGRLRLSLGDRIVIGDEVLELVASRASHSDRVPRDHVTLHKLPAAGPVAPEPELTHRATAFELLGNVFEKALALGHGEDAERMMGTHLRNMLARVQEGQAQPPETLATAARFAVKLAAATGKASWIDFSLELYRAIGRPLPLPIIDELYQLLRRTPGIDQQLLRDYIAELRQRADRLSPPERFALQRLEGLERIAAL